MVWSMFSYILIAASMNIISVSTEQNHDVEIQKLLVQNTKNVPESVTNEKAKRPWETDKWGYTKSDGPDTWPTPCHTGKRQSPINIDLNTSIPTTVTKFQFVNYNLTFQNLTLKNVGHGVMISDFDRNGNIPYLYGGNLSARYYLNQFHFHWSQNFLNGSEHTVDRRHFPAEIHLVHIKENLTLEEALNVDDGVSVLAVFIDLGEDDVALNSLTQSFGEVIKEGSETKVSYTPDLLLPSFTPWFFRYEGSLTTPNCAESVIWTVFLEPILITESQFKALRRITIASSAENDARPIQPLNDRSVRLCLATLPCIDDRCSPNTFSNSNRPNVSNFLLFMLSCLLLNLLAGPSSIKIWIF